MRGGWLLLFAACGGGGKSNDGVDAPPIRDASIDAPMSDACVASTMPPQVVFLNRAGGTYTAGTPDDSRTNVSSLTQETRTFTPTVIDGDWTTVKACVAAKFAPYNVTLTDQDPGTAEHIEIVMLDNPQQFGFSSGVTTVAPSPACANGAGTLSKNTIGVLVWGGTGGTGITNVDRCWYTAHVIGVTMGLDAVTRCEDVMGQTVSGCTIANKSFTSTPAMCGEVTPRNCRCGGTQQTSSARLVANVGARCN